MCIRDSLGVVFAFQLTAGVRSQFRTTPKPPQSVQLRNSVTLPNFISMVGIGIGVWALIVVMAVMSGFEEDLRSKILETNPHILVSPVTFDAGLDVSEEVMQAIQEKPEVSSIERFLEEEAMITSPYNSSVQLTIRGIDPSGVTGERLAGNLVEGSLTLLRRPEHMGSDQAWEFSQERQPRKLETPQIEERERDSDEIVMPPMPGGTAPQGSTSKKIPVLASETFARTLGASLGSQLTLKTGVDNGTLTLEISGIYKRIPTLTYQPDWVVDLSASTAIPPAAIHTSWPISHAEVEALGRVAVMEVGTPLFKTIGTHLLVGEMPNETPSRPLQRLAPYSERVSPGIILGTELASSLRVKLGDCLLYTSPSPRDS